MYYLYVALFGALGAMIRYAIGSAVPSGAFPAGTLLINVTGCFLLAVTVRYLTTIPKMPKNLITGIGTGFIGSFTTFSTFSVEASQLMLQGSSITATGYLVLSIVGGLFSAWLGFYFSDRLILRRERAGDGN